MPLSSRFDLSVASISLPVYRFNHCLFLSFFFFFFFVSPSRCCLLLKTCFKPTDYSIKLFAEDRKSQYRRQWVKRIDRSDILLGFGIVREFERNTGRESVVLIV